MVQAHSQLAVRRRDPHARALVGPDLSRVGGVVDLVVPREQVARDVAGATGVDDGVGHGVLDDVDDVAAPPALPAPSVVAPEAVVRGLAPRGVGDPW